MIKRRHVFLAIAMVLSVGTVSVSAQVDTEFTQTINTGTLTASILDETGQAVATPTVPFSTVATSATCQTDGSTGVLGTNTQRLYVDNPGAATAGWSLSIAATDGPAAEWEGSGANAYAFNDPAGSGCDAGQLTIDPSSATLSLDCVGTCTNTGVSMGTAQPFAAGTTDAATIVNAGANSDDIWRGYLTDIDAMQTIPASQAPDDYSIDMTITAVAL